MHERNLIEKEMAGLKGALLSYAQDELRNLEFEISVLKKSQIKIERYNEPVRFNNFTLTNSTTNPITTLR